MAFSFKIVLTCTSNVVNKFWKKQYQTAVFHPHCHRYIYTSSDCLLLYDQLQAFHAGIWHYKTFHLPVLFSSTFSNRNVWNTTFEISVSYFSSTLHYKTFHFPVRFSLSFHYSIYFLLYFPCLFTIQLRFLPYFSYIFTIQLAFLLYFPYLFTIQLTFLP